VKPRGDRVRSAQGKTAGPRTTSAPSHSRPTPLKRWVFRLAPLALLFAAFFALEAGLRWTGVARSPRYFLPALHQGEKRWIENLRFGWRFFPKQIARTPQPISIRQARAREDFRVFVLGESAALGDPNPAFGMPRILEILLQEALPHRRVQVVNVAMTAINSHVLREIAEECSTREGDVWIVYAGNNEVIGPFGGGTVFGRQAPPRAAIAASLAWRGTGIAQLLESWVARAPSVQDERAGWTGLEMFKDQQVAWADPRLKKVHQHFEANLDYIVKKGLAAGARVVLSTVACNLRDCAPFGASLPGGIQPDLARRWNALYRDGVAAESRADMTSALELYRAAAELEAAHAELQFRIARLLAAQSKDAEAKVHFGQARDHDVQRFRIDSAANEIIRRVAKRHSGEQLGFVDSEQRLSETSPGGIPGRDLFLEHVHFNFEGNYALARLLAPEALRTARAGSGTAPRPILTLQECAARLGFSDWDRYQTLRKIHERLQGLPYTIQLDHGEQLERVQGEMASLRPSLEPGALRAAAARVGDAVRRRSDDWVLRDQHGKLLEAAGDVEGAVAAWMKTHELMPHFVNAPYQIGNLLDSAGRSREAEPFLRAALQPMPHFVEAMNALGLCLTAQKRFAEANSWFAKALEWRPAFATAHVNWGLSLAAEQRPMEAITHYEAALRLRPGHANTHYNLAIALKALNRTNDLLVQLQKTVQLNPQFREARYNLASELAAHGKLEAALAEYKETIARWPELADAHYGLATVHARLHQNQHAEEAAKAALRRNPNHAGARSLLQRLEEPAQR